MKGFFVILLTATVLGLIAAQAKRSKAHRMGNNLLFSPVWTVQAVYIAVLAIGFGLVVLGYSGPQKDRTIVIVGGLLFIIFSVCTWPKAVEVSESQVRQRCWYGRWKEISWADVTSFKEKKSGSIIVSGRKNKIAFAAYHADREVFLERLNRNADFRNSRSSAKTGF
jgi:hypothetical protein